MKNAGGSMLAAAVAATLTFGAAPAEAKLTFGRKEDVAEQEVITLPGTVLTLSHIDHLPSQIALLLIAMLRFMLCAATS